MFPINSTKFKVFSILAKLPYQEVMDMSYILLKNKRNRLLVSLGVFIFVWFFLFTFGVFNFNVFPALERLYRTFIYSFFCFLTLNFSFFIIQDFVIKHYSFRAVALWSVWLTFTVGTSNFLITTLLFERYSMTFYFFLVNQWYVFSTFLLVFPFVLLTNYLFHLKEQLRYANYISGKKEYHSMKESNPDRIMIHSEYKRDHFEMEMEKIIYLNAAGNYVQIHYIDEGKIQHVLVRTTLSSIEKQKIHPAFVRCHRSHIVNIDQVETLLRKEGNDYLVFKKAEVKIPISKGYKDFFQEILSART